MCRWSDNGPQAPPKAHTRLHEIKRPLRSPHALVPGFANPSWEEYYAPCLPAIDRRTWSMTGDYRRPIEAAKAVPQREEAEDLFYSLVQNGPHFNHGECCG